MENVIRDTEVVMSDRLEVKANGNKVLLQGELWQRLKKYSWRGFCLLAFAAMGYRVTFNDQQIQIAEQAQRTQQQQQQSKPSAVSLTEVDCERAAEAATRATIQRLIDEGVLIRRVGRSPSPSKPPPAPVQGPGSKWRDGTEITNSILPVLSSIREEDDGKEGDNP